MERKWLRDMRVSKGWSTYDAGDKAGMSQSYYSAIENGVRGNPLPTDTAKKIAKVFGFDWTRFYEDEDVEG